MAALTRPDTANYEIHERVQVDTAGTFLFRVPWQDIDGVLFSVLVAQETYRLIYAIVVAASTCGMMRF